MVIKLQRICGFTYPYSPPPFIGWIKTFYKNISSCVLNNGFATPYFQLKRCVRQGDPLSPYLFIIALELLAINIRNNNKKRGIKIDQNEVKLVIFADDMTTFVRDTVSFSILINTIEQFSRYSGLKMNHEKTEVIPLGHMELNPRELGVNEISNIVKILGVHFSYLLTIIIFLMRKNLSLSRNL